MKLNRSLGRAAAAALSVAMLVLAGCAFGPISTEKPVFTASDREMPDWARNVFEIADPQDGQTAYLRLVETAGDHHALEIISKGGDEAAQKGLPWSLSWFPAEFIPLGQGFYAVHLLFEHRMKYVHGGAPDYRHGYWIVAAEGEGLRLVELSTVDKTVRARLAAARALTVGDGGEVSGGLTPETFGGFLRDLRDEAERVARAPQTADQTKPVKLRRVPNVPPDAERAAYRFLAQFHSLLPAVATSGDPDVALYLAYLEGLASRGVPEGAYLRARLLVNGWGSGQDFDRARQLAETAVANGYRRANTLLGVLSFNGLGEPVDTPRGLDLLNEGAEAGDPRAMFILSGLYRAGTAVAKDEARDLSWLQRAAELELPDAQSVLGERYLNGQGVARDDVAAFKLFEAAAKLDHADAAAFLGFMQASGRGTETDQAAASQNYLKAAQLGMIWAQWQIGERLIAGTGISPDRQAGLAWLKKAADAGQQEAKAALARHTSTSGGTAGTAGGSASEDEAKVDRMIDEIDDVTGFLKEERAAAEAELKKLCGGRICKNLPDGKTLYRTETYDPPRWYFEDGRLAPRDLWTN